MLKGFDEREDRPSFAFYRISWAAGYRINGMGARAEARRSGKRPRPQSRQRMAMV